MFSGPPRQCLQQLHAILALEDFGRADEGDVGSGAPGGEQHLPDGGLCARAYDKRVGRAAGVEPVEQRVLQHVRAASVGQLRSRDTAHDGGHDAAGTGRASRKSGSCAALPPGQRKEVAVKAVVARQFGVKGGRQQPPLPGGDDAPPALPSGSSSLARTSTPFPTPSIKGADEDGVERPLGRREHRQAELDSNESTCRPKALRSTVISITPNRGWSRRASLERKMAPAHVPHTACCAAKRRRGSINPKVVASLPMVVDSPPG